MDDDAAEQERFANTLAALEEAYVQVTEAIRATSPAQRAFEQATVLADRLREIAENAADVRAWTVARIADEERLPLAVLADRIGVSKARAGKLVQTPERSARTPRRATPHQRTTSLDLSRS